MTIIIAGTITVEPDKVDAAMAAAIPMMQATHQEPGCTAYVFSVDPIEPGVLHVFEKWESDEHLSSHFETEHMAEFQAKVPDLGIVGMDILKYEVAGEGPVR